MLDMTSTLGTLAFDDLLGKTYAPNALPTLASPATLPTDVTASGKEEAAMPTDSTLQTTAEVAGDKQRSVENAVRAGTGLALVGQVTGGVPKSVEIATQLASLIVLTQGLLNSDLEAAGSGPFDLLKVAGADLDRLIEARRLVGTLSATGFDRDGCAVAAARIDAAIERLEILVGIVGGKVGEVRQMIAAIGFKSDIDQFEDSINALLGRIRAVRESTTSISATPANTVTATLIAAANAATEMFQESIAAVVDAIDGAALAGALGGGELAAAPAAMRTLPDSIAALPDKMAALPVVAPPGSALQAQRWLAVLARDHGSLAAAASHYKLDSPAQLELMVEGISARSYDPLHSDNRTLGGSINHLFDRESRVFGTSSRSVLLHAGNLLFDQKTYRVLDALQRSERRDTDDDRQLEASQVAARRRALLGEVVIVPGPNAPADSRPARKAPRAAAARLITPRDATG